MRRRFGTKRITLADSTQGICSSCCLRWAERNEENVAADVAAHHFHDLRVRHVLGAGDLDLIARVDAETPGVLAITVEARRRSAQNCKNDERQRDPLQAIGGLFGERSAADRDSFLPAQKWGFLLRFQIDDACVVERLALDGSLVVRMRHSRKRIQLFLDGGGT